MKAQFKEESENQKEGFQIALKACKKMAQNISIFWKEWLDKVWDLTLLELQSNNICRAAGSPPLAHRTAFCKEGYIDSAATKSQPRNSACL